MINLEKSVERRIKRGNTDWWIHEPAMVGNNGKTYIGYMTDMGEIHVKELDAKCSRAESRDVCLCRVNCNHSDEHNAPSLCVMEDGRILVAYAGHAADHELKYRITERPFDITSFGPERRLSYDGTVTYVQLSENVKKGELWLFCRVSGVTWQFRFSTDGGESWSEPKTFLVSDAGGLFYFNVRKQWVARRKEPVREQWFFALYGHPYKSADHTIRSGVFNSDGQLLNMNEEARELNLYAGGQLELSALDVVYASAEGTTVRLLSVAPTKPYRVGLAAFVFNQPTTIRYYGATWGEEGWTLSDPIAEGGEFLSPATMEDGSQTYVGGMAYYYGVGEWGINPKHPHTPTCTNRLYIARRSKEARVLESYLSTDWGKTYRLEQVIRSIPEGEGIKIWRPIVPIYAQDNMPLYWHEGTYGAHTGGWHCDTVMRIEYDD